ncbi:STAS-like domain-containing protein [Aliarcobacter butzleri]|uniref:STAS-like domain-containing protein n=1 Tax=Aliarcobacter butzleri TaxID=28197 RepID=UPI001260C635|nr:STAS-like domain-containing protein [Aliarcobacter butzleri]MCG3653330.1 STAS-like domain-containing protein [Aliarcobacter butzleri]MCT7547285.1 STAS-like domain-containing protein [Aliarcobacter butzleri]MDN5129989.1 STAS-like domain-containing protein [Aliarcobacter butzleri]
MKERIEYNFATQYSEYPGPRDESIGPFSGERFRIEVLEKLYENEQPILLDIEDVQISFGPSFLSEAFGLFAKKYGIDTFNEFIQVKENSEKAKRFKEKMMEYVKREIENI